MASIIPSQSTHDPESLGHDTATERETEEAKFLSVYTGQSRSADDRVGRARAAFKHRARCVLKDAQR